MNTYNFFDLVTLMPGDTYHLDIIIPPIFIHDYFTQYNSVYTYVHNS